MLHISRVTSGIIRQINQLICHCTIEINQCFLPINVFKLVFIYIHNHPCISLFSSKLLSKYSLMMWFWAKAHWNWWQSDELMESMAQSSQLQWQEQSESMIHAVCLHIILELEQPVNNRVSVRLISGSIMDCFKLGNAFKTGWRYFMYLTESQNLKKDDVFDSIC